MDGCKGRRDIVTRHLGSMSELSSLSKGCTYECVYVGVCVCARVCAYGVQ